MHVQDLALPDKPSIVVLPFDNMDRSRGSQQLAIGADIDVPLSGVREFATGELAIGRWISFPHGDMRRDALAQQPCQ